MADDMVRKPGEAVDSRGVPIYPGDLLRAPHFKDGRGRQYYLYHTIVYEEGFLWKVPTCHLEPTKAKGGKCILTHEQAAVGLVIYGHGPKPYLDYLDRPRRKRGVP